MHIIIATLGIDLKTPAGRLVFGVMAQIAEFERELIRERVKAGMTEARKRGVHTGRKHTLKPSHRAEAARMHQAGKSLGQIAALFGCGSVGGAPGGAGRRARNMTAQRPEHAPLGYRASGPSGGVGVEAVLSIIANLATSISSISTRIVTRVTMRLLFMQECEAVHRSELGLQVNHAHRFGPNWTKPMLRYTLSALALAGFLAAAHPVWADPVSDHAQVEASAAGQEVASPAPASPPGWSSQPASAEHLNDVPVGFGWG